MALSVGELGWVVRDELHTLAPTVRDVKFEAPCLHLRCRMVVMVMLVVARMSPNFPRDHVPGLRISTAFSRDDIGL